MSQWHLYATKTSRGLQLYSVQHSENTNPHIVTRLSHTCVVNVLRYSPGSPKQNATGAQEQETLIAYGDHLWVDRYSNETPRIQRLTHTCERNGSQKEGKTTPFLQIVRVVQRPNNPRLDPIFRQGIENAHTPKVWHNVLQGNVIIGVPILRQQCKL